MWSLVGAALLILVFGVGGAVLPAWAEITDDEEQ